MPTTRDSTGRIPARQFRLEDETLAVLDWIAADCGGLSRSDGVRIAARECAAARGCPAKILAPVKKPKKSAASS